MNVADSIMEVRTVAMLVHVKSMKSINQKITDSFDDGRERNFGVGRSQSGFGNSTVSLQILDLWKEETLEAEALAPIMVEATNL